MKKLYLLPLLLLAFVTNVMAQTPEKLSYQAIVRNSSSEILANQPVGVQISILQSSVNGAAVYVETQNPTTNANGLINLEIGTGTLISGAFNTIDWGNNTYFIKTEIDPDGGSSYTITGTSQLLSVPYALHAKTAESISGGITESDPVFIASVANGISNSDITNWNNKLSAEVDGSITNEIELPTGGTDGQVLKTDGSGNYTWVNQTTDTDTQLDETQVDAFVANNGYLTAEVDGSITNEIELPTGGTDGQVLKTDGSGNYTWVNQTTDTDTNTQLDETQVDAFVANNGYLTAEVDGSITNEIELPTGGTDGQVLKTDGSGNYTWVDLPSGSNSPNVTTVSSNTTLTTDGIVFINGAYTVNLPSNPTDGMEIRVYAINGSAAINGNGKTLYIAQQSFSSLSFSDGAVNGFTCAYSSTLDAWLLNY